MGQPPASPVRMPPVRSVRVHDAVWDTARERAAAEHRTISDVINQLLRDYTA